MEIILASKSPRRRELLSKIASDFKIITADADESLGEMTPREGVSELARRKGRAVLDMLIASGEDANSKMIISSDTLVERLDIPFGKPKNESDAERMLCELSGNEHNVHTGVCVHYMGKAFLGTATTKVKFRELSISEIREYIATGEPMDKAGAYGIQGRAGKFVEYIEGDFDTVVGLSLSLTRSLMDKAAVYG